MVEEGLSDWKNAGSRLTQHESSKSHKDSILAWLEMENRLNQNRSLDTELQKQIKIEVCFVFC